MLGSNPKITLLTNRGMLNNNNKDVELLPLVEMQELVRKLFASFEKR